jgi:FixJ family two-component response regulator
MEGIRPTIAAIKVAVVEDDERMRQAMVFQLSTAGLEVVSYSSAEGFLAAPCANEFDCIVADLFLPRMNGLQLQEKLHRVAPFASIVFVTGHGDLSLGMHAMKKGAVDFLEKPVDDVALLNSINRGAELSRSRRADHVQIAELKARHDSLTSREREVFGQITKGLLNKQVAAQLGTTERTIKAHRERVMSKMAADSLATLVRMAGVLNVHVSRTRASQTE